MKSYLAEHQIILEALIYETFLTEASRLDFLLKTYGEKINQHWPTIASSVPTNIVADMELPEEGDVAPQILAYLAYFDPSPKQVFAQWLVVRFLKGGILLEDLEQIHMMLGVFMQVKNQLAKRDINAYRSKDELADAISPHMATQAASMPQNASVQNRMLQKDQTIVHLNDAVMSVMTPLTKESAAFWGCTTGWCTTWGMPGTRYPDKSNNYFQHYTKDGPLYIIRFKTGDVTVEKNYGGTSTGNLFQFHFHSGQFADSEDQMIDPSPIFAAHPPILNVFSPQEMGYLIKKNYIPLRLIPKENLPTVGRDIIRLLKDKEDIAYLLEMSPETFDDKKFIADIFYSHPEMVRYLPVKYWKDDVADLIENNPFAFEYIGRQRTPELAEVAAERLGNWHNIERIIDKKFWTKKIEDLYYEIKGMDQSVSLSDIPPERRTKIMAVRMLTYKPSQIPEHLGQPYLGDDALLSIMVGNKNNAPGEIPPKYYTKAMVDFLFNEAVAQKYNTLRFRRGTETVTAPQILLDVDKAHWTEPLVKMLIEKGDLGFKKIPENLRTPAVVIDILNKHGFGDVDDHYIDDDVVKAYITAHNVDKIPKRFLSEDIILDAISKSAYSTDYLFKNVPKEFKTEKVMAQFVAKRVVPVKQMPQSLRSEEALIERVRINTKEIADVAPDDLSEAIIIEAIKNDARLLMQVSARKRFMTQEVCRAVVGSVTGSGYYSYGGKERIETAKTVFEMFDRSVWDSEIVAVAIANDLLSPEFKNVPSSLITVDVTATILAKNPEQIEAAPFNVSEDILVAMVKKNPHKINDIPLDMITEPVAYAALNMSYRALDDKALAAVDKSGWIERTYALVVGNRMPLKDVPRKFRTPDLVRAALLRKPSEVTTLRDPVAYFRKHDLVFNDENTLTGLRNAGMVFQKKKGKVEVSQAHDLERIPLENGMTYAKRALGSVNNEVFLFDKKGKVIARFESKGDKILSFVADKKMLMRERANLRTVLKDNFYKHGDFSRYGVFYANGWKLREDIAPETRYGLTYIYASTPDTGEYTVLNGTKPALRFSVTSSSGSWGNSGSSSASVDEILDLGFCLRMTKEIADMLNRLRVDNGWQMSRIGIVQKSDKKFHSIIGKKLTEVNDMSIYRSERDITMFKKKVGMVARATLLKNGTITKIKGPTGSRYDIPKGAEEIFNLVASRIKNS
jgi:hypothetical protein